MYRVALGAALLLAAVAPAALAGTAMQGYDGYSQLCTVAPATAAAPVVGHLFMGDETRLQRCEAAHRGTLSLSCLSPVNCRLSLDHRAWGNGTGSLAGPIEHRLSAVATWTQRTDDGQTHTTELVLCSDQSTKLQPLTCQLHGSVVFKLDRDADGCVGLELTTQVETRDAASELFDHRAASRGLFGVCVEPDGTTSIDPLLPAP